MGLESAKVDRVHDNPLQTTMDHGGDESKPVDCVVGGAHAFILKVSSFFGLAPLRFESHTSGFTVTISNTMCVYSFVLVSFLVTCTICGLAAEINVGTESSVRMSSKMSQMVSTCDVMVVVVTAVAGVCGAPKRMKNMLLFMESLASVDRNIGGHYSVRTERKLCAILLAILIFFLILIVDDFCFYVLQAKKLDRHWDVMVNYIGFYILWCVVIILELQFAFTALSVRARFAALNDALGITARHVSHTLEKPINSPPLNIFAIGVPTVETQRSSNVTVLINSTLSREPTAIIQRSGSGEPRLTVSPCEAVCRLAALRGTLCEVVNRVNDSYGLPLIVILLSTLLHLIVTPYFLIIEISHIIQTKNNLKVLFELVLFVKLTVVSTNRVHFLVLQFLWCATHVLRMFVVVEPCYYTIIECLVRVDGNERSGLTQKARVLVLRGCVSAGCSLAIPFSSHLQDLPQLAIFSEISRCMSNYLKGIVDNQIDGCPYMQGKKTQDLVCRLMSVTPFTGTFPSRIELFCQQLTLQSVCYTPMGMCTLDRPLVASVIGAVTTYLVILIQFQRYEN